MNLTKGIALYIGWLSGSLAGIGAILYACGYLLTSAQLHMLGLSGLVTYGNERYVEEGGRFLIAVMGLLGEILLNLLITGGFLVVLILLIVAPIAYFKREQLRAMQANWQSRLMQLKDNGAWRGSVFALLLVLLLATSEDPQTFNAPLEISSLLFAQAAPTHGSLAGLLIAGNNTSLKAFFANSLLMELKTGTLLLLAWQVASPWRWRLLLTAPFFLIFLLYTLLLPMLYGVLQRQIRLPVVTLTAASAWPGSSAEKLFLLNKNEHEFVLWDAQAKQVLWLPVTAVQAAQIRQIEPLFAKGAATQTQGMP